jgi:hypothetical protein
MIASEGRFERSMNLIACPLTVTCYCGNLGRHGNRATT